MEIKPPERKCVIDINIEADSEEELMAHLEHVLFTFKTSGISRSSVSGGYSTGHIITYRVNEDVTHESWKKALDEYLGRTMALNGKSADKYKCGCCDTISVVGDILKAPNTFNVHDELWGCPHCFAVEDFLRVCDGNGCNSTSVAGMPVGDTYVFLCHDHVEELKGDGTESTTTS